MPPAPVSKHEALRRLASVPPRDLPRAGAASGERPLQSLSAALRASGAASDATGAVGAGFGRGDDADVAALGTIFDAAVDAGLGCLVLDYVAEVCEDPLLTSSDPVEAYLADGACVAAWCRASLSSTRALVEAAATAPLLSQGSGRGGERGGGSARGGGGAGGGRGGGAGDVARVAAEGLATARTRLAALVPLAEALSRGAGGGGGREDVEMNDGADAPAASPSVQLVDEAARLSQCADVLDWAWNEGAAADSLSSSRFSSVAEWHVAVGRRRAAVAGCGGSGRGRSSPFPSSPLAVSVTTTFLDALRARAAGVSTSTASSSTLVQSSSIEYPPAPTPRAAVPAIFLHGVCGGTGGRGVASAAACREARLDLFAYCLADAGGAASLPSLGARFGASGSRVATWRLSQLLDEALALAASAPDDAGAYSALGDDEDDVGGGDPALQQRRGLVDAALDAATRAVPAAASPEAPYELGKALVVLGRPEAALALLRARKNSVPAAPVAVAPYPTRSGHRDDGSDASRFAFERRLDEALTALSARLECGLLSEAFTGARAAAARAAPPGTELHAEATSALTSALARWASDNGELPSVAMFPLSGLEERALLDWLVEASDPSAATSEGEVRRTSRRKRSDAVLQTVLYYLQRGRAPEALLAAAAARGKLVETSTADDPAAAAAEAGALELLRQAARSLPEAQRALSLSGGVGGAPTASLCLVAPGDPSPEGSMRLVLEGWADAPAASLLVSRGGGGEKEVPLLRSLASEAWMEEDGGRRGRNFSGATEGEKQRQKQQQPQLLRPRTRAAAAAAGATTTATTTPSWKAGTAAATATPSMSGFLAPVGAAPVTKKKARLAAVRF